MDTRKGVLGLIVGLAMAGTAQAAVVLVGNPAAGVQGADEISVSTTWTANNTYNLQDQIYVKPGATLTIEKGTVIASTATTSGKAGLAITRGAKIIAIGTVNDPIIFTSTEDVDEWAAMPAHPTGKNPKTGNWREAANEWGNLTLMGRAYMCEDTNAVSTNTATPSASNFGIMEGLVPQVANDPNTLYGGGDDDDDSGTLRYVSLRYGGRVVGLTVELNGLSLGAIGRATDIDHIEIMNNVDDGIEVWGGTVNIKWATIWNVGDDSFDVDQGWRGKAQFFLIVQGYSLDAASGSGVGDNAFEADGAEESYHQPVTTSVIYNATVIGQPVSGASDHATAWRANARMQYRNCIFMDLGERLVSFDNSDGDIPNADDGYGANGTLSWANTWTTDWNVYSGVNPFAGGSDATEYPVQVSGKLAEITDCLFHQNLHAQAYTEANARGVTIAGSSNPALNNVVDNANLPLQTVNRAGPVVKGGTTQIRVTGLDPRPASAAAMNSAGTAPNDGFFSPAQYRGAFSPNKNWLCTWTAADAFGMVIHPGGTCVGKCPADITGNSVVNIDDLVLVITNWGDTGTPGTVVGDVNNSGAVNIDDLVAVIIAWGDC